MTWTGSRLVTFVVPVCEKNQHSDASDRGGKAPLVANTEMSEEPCSERMLQTDYRAL